MKGIKAKPDKQAEVIARVKAGQCLLCGKTARLRRGLCTPCYCKFRREFIGRSHADQVKFERRAIEEGLVLGVQQVRAILNDDPFGKL